MTVRKAPHGVMTSRYACPKTFLAVSTRCYDGQTEAATVLIIYYYETLHECAVYQ